MFWRNLRHNWEVQETGSQWKRFKKYKDKFLGVSSEQIEKRGVSSNNKKRVVLFQTFCF